jgi:hypothetical protein
MRPVLSADCPTRLFSREPNSCGTIARRSTMCRISGWVTWGAGLASRLHELHRSGARRRNHSWASADHNGLEPGAGAALSCVAVSWCRSARALEDPCFGFHREAIGKAGLRVDRSVFSAPRRAALIEWAQDHDGLVIEDDYDVEGIHQPPRAYPELIARPALWQDVVMA